jgi:hypothetical protein
LLPTRRLVVDELEVLMTEAKRKGGWLARRREKRRRERERSGDSPEKATESKKSGDANGDPDVTGAMARTGTTGFLGGGF